MSFALRIIVGALLAGPRDFTYFFVDLVSTSTQPAHEYKTFYILKAKCEDLQLNCTILLLTTKGTYQVCSLRDSRSVVHCNVVNKPKVSDFQPWPVSVGLESGLRLSGFPDPGSLQRLKSRCHLVPQLHESSPEAGSASKLKVVGWIQFLMGLLEWEPVPCWLLARSCLSSLPRWALQHVSLIHLSQQERDCQQDRRHSLL